MRKLLVIAALLLTVVSACTPATPRPTATPAPPTETPRPGNRIFEWPPNSGYRKAPSHKPSSMIPDVTASTDWEIWGIIDGNIDAHGDIEYYNSKNLAFAFGAIITNRNREGTAVEIPDYNGDKCVIPYGMTVTVGMYGQFEPYWYDPGMLLPPD